MLAFAVWRGWPMGGNAHPRIHRHSAKRARHPMRLAVCRPQVRWQHGQRREAPVRGVPGRLSVRPLLLLWRRRQPPKHQHVAMPRGGKRSPEPQSCQTPRVPCRICTACVAGYYLNARNECLKVGDQQGSRCSHLASSQCMLPACAFLADSAAPCTPTPLHSLQLPNGCQTAATDGTCTQW